jgi:hypothetical protein
MFNLNKKNNQHLLIGGVLFVLVLYYMNRESFNAYHHPDASHGSLIKRVKKDKSKLKRRYRN